MYSSHRNEREKGSDSCVLLFDLTCTRCGAQAQSLGTYSAHRDNHSCRGVTVHCGCCNDTFDTWRAISHHLQRSGITQVPPYTAAGDTCIAPPASTESSATATDDSMQSVDLITIDTDLFNIITDPNFPPFYDPSADLLSQLAINLITTPSFQTDPPSATLSVSSPPSLIPEANSPVACVTSCISGVPSDTVSVSPTRPSILSRPPPTVSQYQMSEWVSSFLTAHQHIIGYIVPYK